MLGHEVLVACTEEFVPTAVGAGLPATSTGPAARFADLAADDRPGRDRPGQRAAHGRVFGQMAVRALPGMLPVVEDWQPDLVVHERAEFAGPIAAYVAGAPLVELHWGASPMPEYRAEATRVLRRRLEAVGLDALPAPVEVVNPWPPSLRPGYAGRHASLRAVPQYNGAAPLPDWLLRLRPTRRICFTLGTVVPRTGRNQVTGTVPDIIDALSTLDAEVVVAVDGRVAAAWPPLPPAVGHVGRLPLAQVFTACDVVVHHGGQGTTLTALGAELPQLLLPVFDDQFDNADAVVRAGAGLRLLPDELTPRAVADHCAVLLDDPAYRRHAEVIATEIATQPTPVAVAGYLITIAERTGRLAA
ncbi:nucleotide disphospho-sugar-binding domain-containing protein [Amycolatopsis sp. NPDC051371]|uniref:nucleotide disphospho-sugar-binding domain-containing protein n=1 Tax=Amycolatopsis sp. NPDC051371 TaxID=3155800 RepID=UPI003448FC8E